MGRLRWRLAARRRHSPYEPTAFPRPGPNVRSDLTVSAKQTFQIVSLLATILVVGIHYKTDIPDSPDIGDATINELAQEFVFGGLARVAVPLFAFAAGLFYFRSYDGTWACYRSKLCRRGRTVLLPYFIVASLSTASWLVLQRLQHDPVQWPATVFLQTWLLHPPAEQLWFLRDLMILVASAPLIAWVLSRPLGQAAWLSTWLAAWMIDWQPFPQIASWRLLQVETLLFFSFGAIAARHPEWINRLCDSDRDANRRSLFVMLATWIGLVALRVWLRPDLDLWYVRQYGWADLWLHQFGILVGCVAAVMAASRCRHERLIALSGASFFIFLVHEFPLRAALRHAAGSVTDPRPTCWILVPLALACCFALAWAVRRISPAAFALLTGGRDPEAAKRISRDDRTSVLPVAGPVDGTS